MSRATHILSTSASRHAGPLTYPNRPLDEGCGSTPISLSQAQTAWNDFASGTPDVAFWPPDAPFGAGAAGVIEDRGRRTQYAVDEEGMRESIFKEVGPEGVTEGGMKDTFNANGLTDTEYHLVGPRGTGFQWIETYTPNSRTPRSNYGECCRRRQIVREEDTDYKPEGSAIALTAAVTGQSHNFRPILIDSSEVDDKTFRPRDATILPSPSRHTYIDNNGMTVKGISTTDTRQETVRDLNGRVVNEWSAQILPGPDGTRMICATRTAYKDGLPTCAIGEELKAGEAGTWVSNGWF